MDSAFIRPEAPARTEPPRAYQAQMQLPLSMLTAPSSQGRLFSLDERGRMKGRYARQAQAAAERLYIAGVAMAEGPTGPLTVTIADVDPRTLHLNVVQHYRWTRPEDTAVWHLRSVIGRDWRCVAAVMGGPDVDRTVNLWLGAGEGMLGEMPAAGGHTAALVRAVGGGLVSMYADDGSPEYQDFWSQVVRVRRDGAGEGMQTSIEPSIGDDGYVASLALVVLAARGVRTSLARQAA